MKLRHSAALALVGWYLMTPPAIRGNSAPFTEWGTAGTFDSGDECEKARQALFQKGQKTLGGRDASIGQKLVAKMEQLCYRAFRTRARFSWCLA